MSQRMRATSAFVVLLAVVDSRFDLRAADLLPRPDSCEAVASPLRFAAPLAIALPEGTQNPVLQDLDGDGDLDVAVGSQFILNQGSGMLARPVQQPFRAGFLAAGDFDGDGRSDLVTYNSRSSISVLLNQGEGAFSEKARIEFTGCARNLVTADLDGDGFLDFVTAGSCVEVWKNLGEADFAVLGKRYDIFSEARDLAAVDLDLDGDTDLAGPVESFLSVLRNDGGGVFSGPERYPCGHDPVAVSVADLNRDGKPDLAVTDQEERSISLYLNRSGGSLAARQVLRFPFRPEGLISPDIDGDSDRDLVATAIDYRLNNVVVLKNDGAASFDSAGEFPVGETPVELAGGDLDGDGDADLVVSNRSSHLLSVLMNDGAGGFPRVPRLELVEEPRLLSTGDLDGDQDPDLLVVNSAGQLTVLRNQPGGSLEKAGEYPSGGLAVDLDTGDLDRDGDLDVVATDYQSNGVSVFLNPGGGALSGPTTYPTGTNALSTAITDLDGDEMSDLVVSNTGEASISFLRNQGSGAFAAAATLTNALHSAGLVAADLDGNGEPALALCAADAALGLGAFVHHVAVLLNRGGGRMADPAFSPLVARGLHFLVAADLDGDGDTDLGATSFASQGFWTLPNAGDGSFPLVREHPLAFSTEQVGVFPLLADLDGDGDSDVVRANALFFSVGLLLNDGHGEFPEAPSFGTGGDPQSIVPDDFNQDGRPDLVIASSRMNALSLLLSVTDPFLDCNQNGVNDRNDFCPMIAGFGVSEDLEIGLEPQSLVVSDLNGDGDPDLATANGRSNDVSVLLNTGGAFRPSVSFPAGTAPRSMAAGDLDGDGAADLAVADLGSEQQVTLLFNSGKGTFERSERVPAGDRPNALLQADLDGDSRPDLAVGHRNSNDLWLLQNDGEGGFDPPVKQDLVFSVLSVMGSDLDGDGDVDLAVGTAAPLILLRNAGDGSFERLPDLPVGSAYSVIPADLDGCEVLLSKYGDRHHS